MVAGWFCKSIVVALAAMLSLVAGGCTLDMRIGTGSTAMQATTLPEPTIELRHPSRVVSAGLQISPLSLYPTLMVRTSDTAGRFILDTGGAGALIVTERFLKQAGGRRLANTSTTINGTRYPLAVIPHLEIGDGLILRNATCIISDLDQMRRVCGDIAIDGVLTVGLLQGLELDIDLPNRVAHFRPAHLREQVAGAVELSRPASHAADPRPYAIVRVNGVNVPTLLDTGNYAAIDIPRSLFEPLGVALSQPRDSFGAAGFNSRPAVTQRGTLETIDLGDIALRDAEVHVIPHDEVTEAVIGIAVLQHYRIIYNTHTRTTLLIGAKELTAPAPSPQVVQLVETICRERLR